MALIREIDLLEYLATDENTRVLAFYVEGFDRGEGRRFVQAAAALPKPVIVLKAGKTAAGTRAVTSHTASLAGDYDVARSCLEAAGVVVAESLDEFEDLIKTFTLLGDRPAAGGRVGILSNAGFECSVAADRLGNLELARFSEKTVKVLGDNLPTGFIDVHNPIDATPAITTEKYGNCIEAILADGGVDCAVVSNVASTPFQENLPAGPGHREDINHESSHPNTIIRLFRSTGKPMVVCLNEGAIYDPAVEMMERAGVPVYRKIDRAVRSLRAFVRLKSRKTD